MLSTINPKLSAAAALVIVAGLPSLAYFFYLLKKKSNDLERLDGDEYSNNNSGFVMRQTISEVKIPNDCVKRIIGPQGTVIKELQKTTNTRINFKEKPNPASNEASNNRSNSPKSTESILLIRGSAINVHKAELEIKRMILDMPRSLTQEFMVPDYACGRIIGRGGGNIKEISLMSSCKVMVHRESMSMENVSNSRGSIGPIALNYENAKLLSLSGSVEQIEMAKNLILEKIKEEDVLRERRNKVLNKKYETKQSNISQTNKSYSLSDNAISQFNQTSVNDDATAKFAPLPLPDLVDFKSYLDAERKIDVIVTAIATPFAFWAQLCQNQKDLSKLLKEMNNFYKTIDIRLNFNEPNELKEVIMVAAKSRMNTWHRGEVKGIEVEKNLVDIYYVDYGDSDYVNLSDLRRLEPKFYELPLQAVEFRLDGIEFPDDVKSWSEEAIIFFENVVYSSEIKSLELISTDNSKKSSVRLYDYEKNVSIADLLVDKGYCRKIQ